MMSKSFIKSNCCLAMKSIKKEIISRETIKPSSPTPTHLRSYQLSMLDQFAPRMHVRFALFYEGPFDHHRHPSSHDIDSSPELPRDRLAPLLKQSLSQVLTHYYPLAGRFRDLIAIDCNDEGVEFVECRVNCAVSEVLDDSYTRKLDLFFPADVLETCPGMVLVIQVSLLERGGVAIGVSCSHVVADASSLSTFVNDWASKARLSSVPPAEFVGSSILPPVDPLKVPESAFEAREKGVVVTKRILFDASRIALLKEMARGSGVENPTRVELVMALILKRAAASAAASKAVAGQHLKELVAIQAVDLRRRLVPPLSSRSFGNAVGALAFKTRTDEEGMDYGKLVRKLRDEKENFFKQVAESSSSFLVQNMQEVGKVLLDVVGEETNLYSFSSWCGFGFYDADFGLGKPIWLAESANDRYRNLISLTDTGDKKGGGIEVHVSLEAREMALFERNLETLATPS